MVSWVVDWRREIECRSGGWRSRLAGDATYGQSANVLSPASRLLQIGEGLMSRCSIMSSLGCRHNILKVQPVFEPCSPCWVKPFARRRHAASGSPAKSQSRLDLKTADGRDTNCTN